MPGTNARRGPLQTVNDYFARKPATECSMDCIDLIDAYFTDLQRSRYMIYKSAHLKYFDGYMTKGMLYRQGQQGELSAIDVNHFHNLIDHVLSMTCSEKLSYEPQAIDSGYQASEQVKLARGILETYTLDVNVDLDGILRQATMLSMIFGEGYVSCLWDKTKGKTLLYDPDSTTNVRKEGDVDLKTHSPWDVIRDIHLSSPENECWYILREEVSKVDLAVMYPHFEEEIMKESSAQSMKQRHVYPCLSENGDLIFKYTLFHKRTPAVPQGRMMSFINDRIALEDGPLPEEYDSIPVYRIASEELYGSPWGYSRAYDLLPVCDSINRLYSALLTNNLTFAVQNLLIPDDGSYNPATNYGGLNVIKWNAEKGAAYKPEALQLTASSKETYQFLNILEQVAGTLMGVNEVVRGNPDLVLKGNASGAAMALLSTNSIQFNSDIDKAHKRLAERVGTAIIKLLAAKAYDMRDGMSYSMSGKLFKKRFNRESLSQINKVVVKIGNPLTQSTAGKIQIADSLLQQGLITNKQEYMNLVQTGNLESIYESAESQISLIKEENDMLLQGQPIPPAYWSEDHVSHILEHQVVISNLAAKMNQAVLMHTSQHIQGHMDFLAGNKVHGPLNPIIAKLNNQPILNVGTPNQIVLPAAPAAPAAPAKP